MTRASQSIPIKYNTIFKGAMDVACPWGSGAALQRLPCHSGGCSGIAHCTRPHAAWPAFEDWGCFALFWCSCHSASQQPAELCQHLSESRPCRHQWRRRQAVALPQFIANGRHLPGTATNLRFILHACCFSKVQHQPTRLPFTGVIGNRRAPGQKLLGPARLWMRSATTGAVPLGSPLTVCASWHLYPWSGHLR